MGHHHELDERRVLAQGVDPRIHGATARDRDFLDAAAVAAQEPHEAGEVRTNPRLRERDLGDNVGIQVIKVAGAVRIANPRFRVLERQRDRR